MLEKVKIWIVYKGFINNEGVFYYFNVKES